MNREIRRIVDGVPDSRSPMIGWADPVGELDRRLDVVVGAVGEPDEALVKAINQALSARQRAVVYRYGVRLLGRGVNAADPTPSRTTSTGPGAIPSSSRSRVGITNLPALSMVAPMPGSYQFSGIGGRSRDRRTLLVPFTKWYPYNP